MKNVFHQAALDEQRRELTRLLIENLSIPAFCYDFRLDRKTLIAVMAGSKPYTDKLWDEVCSKTGLGQSGNTQVPKLRTNMDRLYLLDKWLGSESVEQAAARHEVDPSLIYRYFIHVENLNARHAMRLAAALKLPHNYFEVTPLPSEASVMQSPDAYSHRYPPRGFNNDALKNRLENLRALIGNYNIQEFCRTFNLESRKIHAVLIGGTQMNRVLCREVTNALGLNSNFFDTPTSDLDCSEILSIHNEVKLWPVTEQLRVLRQKTLAHLICLDNYR